MYRVLLLTFLLLGLMLSGSACDQVVSSPSETQVDELSEEVLSKRPGTVPVCHVSKNVRGRNLAVRLVFVRPDRAERLIDQHCVRDVCDYNPLDSGASGDIRKDYNRDGIADGCEIPFEFAIRGRLANPGYENQKMKSTYYFAGNWRNGVQFYEYNPSPNTGLYTQHPADARHLGWSESMNNRLFALDEMIGAGANVVNMSDWGLRGTNNWAYWAPMQTSTYAHDELFAAVSGRDILIAPYLESYKETRSSPSFYFHEEFPGSAFDPAPALVARIEQLLQRYVKRSRSNKWPAQWAQMYDKNGKKRFVISLIHVSSSQSGVTHSSFANGFDLVANKVYKDTGIRVGFTLDMLPWDTNAPGSFKPRPEAIGPLLLQQESVLAIQCFIPEIWTGSGDDVTLANWKQAFSNQWLRTGLPFIQDVSPGYDAHIVFPSSVFYGHTPYWRGRLTQLVQNPDVDGVTFNTWNGYTEGFAGVPTLEQGTANFDWMTNLFSSIP